MTNVVRLRRQEKHEGPAQKNCVAKAKGCHGTLSAASLFDECPGCRRHDRKYGGADVDIKDIERLYDRATLAVWRFTKHLGRKVSTTVRKRA